ncbi:MAG: glycosyltransferase family 2 protein [Deltaproteobacteria bacterium]|nr:glycosyltransferase family 2 protein [Deltaproteobacteria bacterium]
MRVLGIMINYRTADLTAKAADCLLAELDAIGDSHLLVIDNDSKDGSYEKLVQESAARDWGTRATVIASPRNGGYGYGINVGAAWGFAQPSPPDYIYVLNSDAFAVAASLRKMVAYMDAHPDVGLAGNDICGTEGQVQVSAFRFPTAWSELESYAQLKILSKMFGDRVVALGQSSQDREVDWVPGTSMLIRAAAWRRVGAFDEGFFLYFEEVDYCHRMRDAGWKVAYVANAPVTHIGSVSTGLDDESREMPQYWFDSRYRYFRKHHGKAYAAFSDLAFLLGHVTYLAKRRAQGQRATLRPSLLKNFVRFSVASFLNSGVPGDAAAQAQAPTT